MQQNTKLQTYVGFCVRSGKIVYGVDNVETFRKRVYLLLADDGLKDNSRNVLVRAQERFGCPLLFAKEGVLASLVHKDGVKVVAIRDEHLAKAIYGEAISDAQFNLYSGGTN